MEDLKLRLRGASPMLLHNGQLANPLNKYARQLKAVSGKRNKTEDDFEKMSKIEFAAGWYLGPKGEYVLPAHNIEACLLEGAKKHKNGRLVQGGAYVLDDPALVFDGSDKSPDDLWNAGTYALLVSVKVQKNRVMRTRPLVPSGWTTEIVVRYDPEVVQPEAIVQALEVAGLERGLGDWRPKYGRFTAEKL